VSGGPGAFVCVVGPSGAGKDSLIAHARMALATEPAFLFVRRLVTRASGAFEDHDTLSEEAFARGASEGAFALSWRAHGLGYAVPLAVGAAVDAGAVAVCNLSRTAIGEARRRFPKVLVVCVTAPAEVIATRLAARGRESGDRVLARIGREAVAEAVIGDCVIVNDGLVSAGGAVLVDFLRGVRVAPTL
jgi:ribose 1,5-bisphosphokinase